MKEDFITIKKQLPGICRVASDFYMQPKKKGSVFFVKSPATPDRTDSLAIYPSSNRFCDFANGNHSGDVISFVAYVRGCNQWEALKELKSYYGLFNSQEQDKQETRRHIQLQQLEEHRRREREQEFRVAWRKEVEDLKWWEGVCKKALEEHRFPPFSESQASLVSELQQVSYKLDILCLNGSRKDIEEILMEAGYKL